MPNGKLSDKYKGRPFGEIAKDIQSKYADRYDPISKRGLMSEMEALKEQQEFQKAKIQAREQLTQALAQAQNPQAMQDPIQTQQAPMQASNQGVAPEMMQQDANMGHPASASYNQQFGYGGTMDYFNGGMFGDNDPNNPLFNRANFAPQYPKPQPIVNINNNTQDAWSQFNNPNYIKPQPAVNFLQGSGWNNFNGTPQVQEQSNQIQETPLNAQSNQVVAKPKVTNTIGRVKEMPITAPKIQVSDRVNNDIEMALSQVRLNKLLENRITPGIQQRPTTNTSNQNNNSGQGESNNPLRYAPLAANLFGILSARKAPSTQSEMARMGYKTSIDETLGSQVSPRQTLFNNLDVSQLERGITNQARGFTGANLNASGGSGGQFIANELGNQSNVMNAIANARMQSQQMDQRTQAMNAQEQARIDQFMQGQAGQRQQAQAQNIGIGMQMADLDARNLGAFNTNRSNQIAGLATNLGNIGKEEDQMKMIANALGYTSFGNFFEGLSAEDKAKFLPGLLQMFNRG